MYSLINILIAITFTIAMSTTLNLIIRILLYIMVNSKTHSFILYHRYPRNYVIYIGCSWGLFYYLIHI